MANRERGEYTLVALDRSYVLRLTVEACCQVEDRTGVVLRTIIDRVNHGQASGCTALLWAALQDQHGLDVPTFAAAGAIVDTAGGMRRVMPVLSAFMALNRDDSPATDGEASEARPAAQRWRQLYIDARVGGLAPETFWRLSLRELWRELAAQHDQREAAHKRDRALAWHTAALTRTEKMPRFDKFVGSTAKRATKQSWQDMKSAMNALMGITPKESTA